MFGMRKEYILRGKDGNFFADQELSPSQNHEIYDEILQMQKEFASMLYLQKDLQRDL